LSHHQWLASVGSQDPETVQGTTRVTFFFNRKAEKRLLASTHSHSDDAHYDDDDALFFSSAACSEAVFNVYINYMHLFSWSCITASFYKSKILCRIKRTGNQLPRHFVGLSSWISFLGTGCA
jgi:hypothetical protein